MSYYSTSPGTRTTLLYSIELARLLIVRSLLLCAYGIAYCNKRALPGKFRAGAKASMSGGKDGRTLVAYISSVEDADYKIEPYRSYGNDWQPWVYNSKLPRPALVFK